ncbi:MAG: adenylate kinase [Bdellovibrio sp.]|nr:MAG: adenylate kinase [Bdellovibrio sp.]
MNIILFGAPGAGKGTQSALLVGRKGYHQVSTGDLFRAAIQNQTELGLKAKSFVDRGSLVPDELVVGMVEEELQSLGGKPFILDGFPRNIPQAEALESALRRTGIKVDKVFSLEVPFEILKERLVGRRVCSNCGQVYHVLSSPPKKEGVCDRCGGKVIQRKDDQEDVIENRLTTYMNSTSPLKAYYKAKGRLVEIDGNRDAEKVLHELEKGMV